MRAGILSEPGGTTPVNRRSLLEQKHDAIMVLAKKYGILNIRICGSVARGEDTAMSDIDLLVEMEQGRSLLSLGSFLMDLQDLLGCRVDVLMEKGLKKRVLERVLKEAVPL